MAARRTGLSVAVLAVLAAVVIAGRWYAARRAIPALTPSLLTLAVTSDADRGPGTLRDALFVADAAGGAARIAIRVPRITIQSALPPLVNAHGLQFVVPAGGVQIDARALSAGGPVFDVDAENVSLNGVSIDHCAGTAVLVRAARFQLTDSRISACDVAVEIAGNAREVALERNRFEANHIGVRFTAASRDTVVVKNQFAGNSTAGIWLVASQADAGTDAISVHDNQFSGESTDVVLGNVSTVLEHNDFAGAQTAAVHVVGAGAVVRNNHVAGGEAAGILLENARGAVVEGNELDHLAGYAILLRGAADTLVRDNRIQSCAYGLAFVLGVAGRPNTAADNTLIDLRYDGIDVIGESPVLRGNRVLQARAAPVHVENFSGPGGQFVRAQPLFEKNSFAPVAVAATAPALGAVRPP